MVEDKFEDVTAAGVDDLHRLAGQHLQGGGAAVAQVHPAEKDCLTLQRIAGGIDEIRAVMLRPEEEKSIGFHRIGKKLHIPLDPEAPRKRWLFLAAQSSAVAGFRS